MKKTVITFGLISGLISTLLMVGTMPFVHRIGNDKALILGYTSIVLSFLLVYFGIRSYRDNVADGHISFGKAFGVGNLHHADFVHVLRGDLGSFVSHGLSKLHG